MTEIVTIEEREAVQGEKMIEIRIRFWTNDIAEGKGKIRPKNAWARGVVRMSKNKPHDIIPNSPIPFNSLMELPSVIEKVLIAHGITLHASPKMNKYIESQK